MSIPIAKGACDFCGTSIDADADDALVLGWWCCETCNFKIRDYLFELRLKYEKKVEKEDV